MYCFCFEDILVNVFIQSEEKDEHTDIFKEDMRATLRVRWKFESNLELNKRVWKLNKLEERTLSSDYKNIAELMMVF